MKTKLLILSFALVTTFSQVSLAVRPDHIMTRTPEELTPITWVGSLHCEDKEPDAVHNGNHKCDLEFTNKETGESWNVKANPTLTAIHQKSNRDQTVHIKGTRSPRYLLGGSYVEISEIETLQSVARDAGEPSHTCALGNETKKSL